MSRRNFYFPTCYRQIRIYLSTFFVFRIENNPNSFRQLLRHSAPIQPHFHTTHRIIVQNIPPAASRHHQKREENHAKQPCYIFHSLSSPCCYKPHQRYFCLGGAYEVIACTTFPNQVSLIRSVLLVLRSQITYA